MLHKAERRTATTKTVGETKAEAVAFVVGKTIGLEAGRASADYIHLYHGNAALLTESGKYPSWGARKLKARLEQLDCNPIARARRNGWQAGLHGFPVLTGCGGRCGHPPANDL